jgi:hypothetical protein
MSVSSIYSEHTLAARIRGLNGMDAVEDKPENLYQFKGMAEDMIEAYEKGLLKWTDEATALKPAVVQVAEKPVRTTEDIRNIKIALLFLLAIMSASLFFTVKVFQHGKTHDFIDRVESGIIDRTDEYRVDLGEIIK